MLLKIRLSDTMIEDLDVVINFQSYDPSGLGIKESECLPISESVQKYRSYIILTNWYMKCDVNYPRKPIKSTELKNKKEGGENLFKSTQYCKIRTNGKL